MDEQDDMEGSGRLAGRGEGLPRKSTGRRAAPDTPGPGEGVYETRAGAGLRESRLRADAHVRSRPRTSGHDLDIRATRRRKRKRPESEAAAVAAAARRGGVRRVQRVRRRGSSGRGAAP